MPSARPTQKKARRNPERTRGLILTAAFAEFSQNGLAGARVDLVARRAGVNKRMLYHYFTDKHGLFREVIRRRMTDRTRWLSAAPEDPAEMAHYWYSLMWNDLDWIRLLEWEALEIAESDIIAEEKRQEVFQNALERIQEGQRNGLIAAHYDPAQVLLSIMAITSFPLAFPQLTKMVTGFSISSEEFHRSRLKFLKQFVVAFRPPGQLVNARSKAKREKA
jgi:TetR/AcrR family transcriptional regulator